jgi:hypothetical protein
VKCNVPGTTTRGGKNMIEITGYDHTNNRGFKKLIFSEKQGGGATVLSGVADTIQKDDWLEMTLDDTQYTNITHMKKISEPAGGNSVPDSTQGQSSSGGGKKSNLTKEEWALKDAKKELSMARHKAIEASAIIAGGKGISKAVVESIQKLADRFTAYILTGDFNASVVVPELEKPVAQTDNTPAVDNKEPGDEQGAGGKPEPGDDDIPF